MCYKYKPEEFQAFLKSMRERQHDVVTRWWERRFVPTMRRGDPIAVVMFGVGRAALEVRLIESLIEGGVKISSVTLSEPEASHIQELRVVVERMRARYPDIIFHLDSAKLEEFQPTGTMPRRFGLTVGSQVLYYPEDRRSAFRKLTDELLEADGVSVLTLQMPMAKALVNLELVTEHGWPPSGELTHLGMIEVFAREAGIRFDREVLWADLDVTNVFDDTSEEGASLLNFLVANDVRSLGSTTAIAQARGAVRHHCYPEPSNEQLIIFPQPVGVMVAYGPDATVLPGF